MHTIVPDNSKGHFTGSMGFTRTYVPRLPPLLLLPEDVHTYEWTPTNKRSYRQAMRDARRGSTWAKRKQKLAAHIYIEQVTADKAFLDLFHSAEDNARIAQRYVEAVK